MTLALVARHLVTLDQDVPRLVSLDQVAHRPATLDVVGPCNEGEDAVDRRLRIGAADLRLEDALYLTS